MINKSQMKKMKAAKMSKPLAPKFQGKGTKARLNTAAEKHFFNSKASK
jgi:hypothetical protein